jgi:hypothetical protein
MRRAASAHGTVMRFFCRIALMNSATVILVSSGIACLLVSGLVMSKLTPRGGREAPAWMKTEFGQTAMALGFFILMIAGVAMIAKALL